MSRRATLPQPTDQSDLERAAYTRMKQVGLLPQAREFHGIPGRKFRFDFAWPDRKVALECEGGVWQENRTGHTAGKHYEKDCEKYSLAAANGWLVIRATNHQIESGEFLTWVRQALELRGAA